MLKLLAIYMALIALPIPSAAALDTCVADELKIAAAVGRVIYVRKDGIEDPVPNANLELRQIKNDELVIVAKTTSDENGHFQFPIVATGKYQLFVTAPQMVNFGTGLKIVKDTKSKQHEKEIVVVMGLLFNGCSHASVRKVKSK